MRKKIFSIILAATMAMSLAACGGGDSKETAKEGDERERARVPESAF